MLNKRQSIGILILLLLISGALGLGLSQLQYDYNVERLFPESDAELQFFSAFRERFENENDYMALAIYREAGIYDQAFLEEVDSLSRSLLQEEKVLEVSSIVNATFRKLNVIGLGATIPLIHLDQPERYAEDSTFLASVPHFRYNLVATDARSLCMYLRIEKGLGPEAADQMLQQIQERVGALSFEKVYYSGGVYTQRSQTQLVEKEMIFLGLGSVLLILAFLFWVFRTWWGIVLPLLVVGLSVIWTIGIMGWVGVEINVMTVLIPSILLVVGVSDVVHLLNRYLAEIKHEASQSKALYQAWKEVGLATFLTSLTTALGFLTLLGTGISPYQHLGGFAALGVLIAYVLTFSLLPALLLLLPLPKAKAFHRQGKVWYRLLHRSLAWIFSYRIQIALCSALILVLSSWGMKQLGIEAFITDELAKDHPLQADIQFFEANYGGVRPFTMSLQLGDSAQSVLAVPVLREIDKLETYLRQQYGVRRTYSLIGNLKAANSSLHEGLARFYRLPRNDKTLTTLVEQLKFFGAENGLYDIMLEDETETRISGALPDLGLRAYAQKNDSLRQFIADSISTDLLQPYLTGSATLLDRSHETVVRNMLQGLGLGVGVVALLMGLLYRSWRMWIIALIVNLLPLVLIGALMGYLGIGLKMSTAVIFSLAFGIAVDDTIHFISKLKIELDKGKNLPQAIKCTYLSTGKAIVLTSLILASGFLGLLTSDFQGTYYMGLLVGLALLLAMMADLVVLPVLLLVFPPRNRKKS